jgi:hypothetical protein
MLLLAGRRLAAIGILSASVVLAACSDDRDDDELTSRTTSTPTSLTSSSSTEPPATAPPRPTSTTTTSFAPETVEGAIEAAYLHAWDVYADAVYNLQLDEEALAGALAGLQLETTRGEILERITDGRASHVRVEHDYDIWTIDERTAIVFDQYRNHQVLIDPRSKVPVEADPDELVVRESTMSFDGSRWRLEVLEDVR